MPSDRDGLAMDARTQQAVIFDLDGVLRHFDEAQGKQIAANYGTSLVKLATAAFEPRLIEQVTTGAISKASWIEEVGEATHPGAAAEWLGGAGELDQAMLELVRELRASGVLVGVLTNGTDETRREAAELGLLSEVDAFVSTAEVGFCKPDRRAFQAVLESLGVRASEAFFTDDTAEHVMAARKLGMVAHVFRGIEGLREALGRGVGES